MNHLTKKSSVRSSMTFLLAALNIIIIKYSFINNNPRLYWLLLLWIPLLIVALADKWQSHQAFARFFSKPQQPSLFSGVSTTSQRDRYWSDEPEEKSKSLHTPFTLQHGLDTKARLS